MNQRDFLQLALYISALVAITPALGRFMAQVFEGKPHFLRRALEPVEHLIYKLGGVHSSREMDWKSYTGALLVFNALGFLVVLALQMTQAWLPLNPAHQPNVPFALAFNTAASFMTNT